MEIVIGQVGNLRDQERLEYLYPPEKVMKPAAKHIGFTKQKRPELWPVKDEHSRPPYQDDLNLCYRVQSSTWHKSVSQGLFGIRNYLFSCRPT